MRDARAQAAEAPRAGRDVTGAGFALFDVLLALMILALIAAVVLPGARRPAGPLALRTAAYRLSAMLRDMRTAAIAAGQPVTARIEVGAGVASVVAGSAAVEMPPGTAVAFLDRRRPGLSFAPDGTSSGATFVLRTDAARVDVAVSRDTGAIAIAAP